MQLELPIMRRVSPETDRWQKLQKQTQSAVVQKLAKLIEKAVSEKRNESKGGKNEWQ